MQKPNRVSELENRIGVGFRPVAEMELTLLKGHLLIEELLTEVLRLTIGENNPIGIKITPRMMFAQKLNLC